MTLTDHFAERLAQHGNIAKAAAQVGQTAAWGRRQFKAIVEQLGAQAA